MALREITQSRQITATIRLDEKAAFIHALAGDGVQLALEHVFSRDRDFPEYLKSAESAGATPTLNIWHLRRRLGQSERLWRIGRANFFCAGSDREHLQGSSIRFIPCFS